MPGRWLRLQGRGKLDSSFVCAQSVMNLANLRLRRRGLLRAGLLGAAGVGLGKALMRESSPDVNVADFGAVGDLLTDDSAAINAAIDEVSRRGGGRVRLMQRHLVSLSENPELSGFFSAIRLRSGVSLVGLGADATTVKLVDATPAYSSASIIQNLALDTGDERISISDLHLDANGPNQSQYVFGLQMVRVHGFLCERVRVTNVFGNANFPPGETFHLYASLSSDVVFRECQALGLAGTQGSGLGDAGSTNVLYESCRADGMTHGFGFASFRSRHVSRIGCAASRNGSGGFNEELSEVRNVACTAGGLSKADSEVGARPVDGGNGFIVNGASVDLEACESVDNSGNGLVVTDGLGPARCTVNVGQYEHNEFAGIAITSPEVAHGCQISSATRTEGNGVGGFTIGAAGPGAFDGTHGDALPAPAVPGPSVPVTNDFPFDVEIAVDGAFEYVSVDGVQTVSAVTARAAPGALVAVAYDGPPPTWTWTRA